jgi:hypothetical protein
MYKKIALSFFAVVVVSIAGSVQAANWSEEQTIGYYEYQKKRDANLHQKETVKAYIQLKKIPYIEHNAEHKWKKMLDEHARKGWKEKKILEWLRCKAYYGHLDEKLLTLCKKAYKSGPNGEPLPLTKDARKQRRHDWVYGEQAQIKAEKEAALQALEAIMEAEKAPEKARIITERARRKDERHRIRAEAYRKLMGIDPA